jgi:glycosyltransferase involved in cell wall biosynthesis
MQPAQGLFVHRRLQHLAQLADLRVVSPFAIVQYGNPKGKRIRLNERHCPANRMEGDLPICHPRWFYPPFSGSLIAFWLSLQMIRPLLRIRKEFPFEIIDTHFGHPDGIAGALLSLALGVPFTMTLRGNEPKHSRSRLGRLWMGWALRRASRVFTVSEKLRQFAIGLGAASARVKTIPNGVDARVFSPRDRTDCRIKHGFALDLPIIVSAGALVERKGHHRIIQAVKSICADGYKVQLVIAGGPGPEGQYEGRLRDLVSDLGMETAVRFLGPVSAGTLAEVMSAADVFCLASTNEGWPNVVHESLACGTPVVATEVGAVSEMLAGGRYGVIVPVNHPSMLKDALEEALRRDWNRSDIASWGGARVWSHVAAEVYEEMQAIVAENPRAARVTK